MSVPFFSYHTIQFFSTVDVTVYYNGFHGDLNETLFVGEVDGESKKLVKITHECLQEAIKIGKTKVKIVTHESVHWPLCIYTLSKNYNTIVNSCFSETRCPLS